MCPQRVSRQVKALRPTNDTNWTVERQARTSEARRLLSEHNNLSVGGARDVRAG